MLGWIGREAGMVDKWIGEVDVSQKNARLGAGLLDS
jgi:hypothetical protein